MTRTAAAPEVTVLDLNVDGDAPYQTSWEHGDRGGAREDTQVGGIASSWAECQGTLRFRRGRTHATLRVPLREV